jgi:hypothetical protein
VFCVACGRNLSGVSRLPTFSGWSAGRTGGNAVAAFLEGMRGAGEPGATEIPTGGRAVFRRAPRVRGWVVRPVDREDFDAPRRYEPGLLLSVEGRFHRLDSELRGWGQRDFPTYAHTVSREPVDPPLDERLVSELSIILAAHGIAAG